MREEERREREKKHKKERKRKRKEEKRREYLCVEFFVMVTCFDGGPLDGEVLNDVTQRHFQIVCLEI